MYKTVIKMVQYNMIAPMGSIWSESSRWFVLISPPSIQHTDKTLKFGNLASDTLVHLILLPVMRRNVKLDIDIMDVNCWIERIFRETVVLSYIIIQLKRRNISANIILYNSFHFISILISTHCTCIIFGYLKLRSKLRQPPWPESSHLLLKI